MNEIVNQLFETMKSYAAATGFPANAVEMSRETLEILKKESETIDLRSQDCRWPLDGAMIFLNNEMETGKINIGRIEQFIQNRAYKEAFERLRASVCEAEKATSFFKSKDFRKRVYRASRRIYGRGRKEIAVLLEATSADSSDEAVEAALRRVANIATQTVFSFSEVISEVSSAVRHGGKTLDEALCSLEARYGVLKMEADT